MSFTSVELWQRIQQAGLATEIECRQWASKVQHALADDQPSSGLRVLQWLIETKRLTTYQAKILVGQSSQPLRLGSWSIRQQLPAPLWSEWYAVHKLSRGESHHESKEADREHVFWARRVDATRLATLRMAAPSLRRALQLAALEHESIQGTLPPELSDGQLLVFVKPQAGQPLSEKFRGGDCSVDISVSLVRQVASALAALHQRGIAHGRVMPDRVYWHEDRVVLVIDPLCAATATALESQTGLLGEALEPFNSSQFIAPEIQFAEHSPTPATDVYSLGCLWWWLLTGEPPHLSGSPLAEGKQTAQPQLMLPAGVRLPEPLRQCLRHALGRNLSSRFCSADAFLRALEVALAPISKQRPRVGRLVPKSASQLPESFTPGVKQHRRGIPWFVPVLAGCGLSVLLLLGLLLSGALTPIPTAADKFSSTTAAGTSVRSAITTGGTHTGNTGGTDPRGAHYQIVDAGDGFAWAPPSTPSPLPIDLLPPGAQLFVSFRPADLLDADRAGRDLIATLDRQTSPLLSSIGQMVGLPLEEIAQITIAFYASGSSSDLPPMCLRCELVAPRTLRQLTSGLPGELSTQLVGEHALLVTSHQLSYYVPTQPLVDSQSVSQFSVGPLELMREAAQLHGASGPLLPQLEKQWEQSDRQAELSLFGSTPFLLNEGRELLATGLGPRTAGLTTQWKELLGGDLRAIGVTMRLEPQWYVEARLIGANELEAGKMLAKYRRTLLNLPDLVESNLVSQTPHPYWRAIALRFPQMLRAYADHTRFGVERGVAIINTYLPSEAASNVLLASWLAIHHGSRVANTAASSGPTTSTTMTPLSIDEFLARPIRLSFEQEPIEGALSLVAEEANSSLPRGSLALRFSLDGDAFEKAGITRNQQLRELRIDGQAVRDALTEIAKRGNPVTTVTDTRHEEQRLVWVVAPDPENSTRSMIWLTTRTAAQAAGFELPTEFR